GSVRFISAGNEFHVVTKNIKRVDAKYKKTGGVTHRSDVYSFRAVFSKVLSGRTAVLPDQKLGGGLLSQVKKSHLDRPFTRQIVKRFDIASRLQSIYESLELSMNAVEGTSSNYDHLWHSFKMWQLGKNLDHLKIGLNNIKKATNTFDSAYCIGSGGFGNVYKAELEHFDSSDSSSIEGVDKCDLSRKRSTVAIKWINHPAEVQGFIAEIESLTSCKHENIISLLGFCDEGRDHMILVYELASKGSLEDYMSNSDKMNTLTWVQRLKICLDIAHGMNYLHTNTDHGKQKIIHRDVKSANILLGDNWEAKISDFGLSFIHPADQDTDTFSVNEIAGTSVYLDPEYKKHGRLSYKSDIYSFGVLLFEILTGRLAYDSIYTKVNEEGIAPIARDHFKNGTLMEIVDHKIKEETVGHVFSLSKGPNKEPLDIFSELAFRCVAEKQAQRPPIEDVINELKKALYCQIMSLSSNDFDHLYIPVEIVLSATNNFADENLTRKDGFANEYKGQLSLSGESINIAARRLNKEWDGGEQQFWMEISMLYNLKHKNVVSLVGFCDENGQKIIVIKHQTRESLRNYLSDPMMTWVRRLEISVALAHALSYIHYDEPRNFSLIHRDIKSYSVLLDDNWEPKLCDFQLSMKIKSSQRHLSFNDTLCGTLGYTDPAYINTHSVSQKSDLYSFGIVLFELLCGRKSVSDYGDNKYLAPVATFHYREKILDDIIDLGLWIQMDPESRNVFAETAYMCVNEEPSERPSIGEIVKRLETALKLQPERQNAEHSIAAAEVKGTSLGHDKGSVNFISTRVVSHDREKIMSSFEDLSHLKLSKQDMEFTTNELAPENIIRDSGRKTIYKGRLLHPEQLDIIGKVLLSDSVKDESKTFWMEILMLSSLKHKNLVSLIGYYDEEGAEKIIIYKREANESLSKHLDNQNLTWMQRLNICVGVANALSYIHYDAKRDFSVIHCNIKSSKILLDDKWEPKLSGFELSLKNTVARRHRLLLTRDIGKNVYLDPKYNKTGGVTHKSDVYSFGVVLLEVLCGRSAADKDELGEGLLSQLAKSRLDNMIDPHLLKQMDPESLRIFSETAYYCLKEERADRPYINQVVKRLEKALGLQWKHEKPELPRNPFDGASSSHLKRKNLEHLKIALNDIELATENFSDKYYIGKGGFGVVYKAQLEHFDSSNSSSIEGENKCDFPKKRSTVAIKRINSPKGEQGFNVEIETLTSCKHENVISLLGFCDEDRDHMILVYELASKGSLEDYLGNSDKMTNFNWMQRLKICLDIAHGLNYIHSNTDHDKQKIIHRDIKSANILLDDDWKAKIADFGLSKFHPPDQDASTLNASTIAGTDTYLDPEYDMSGKLNKKSDIYSFGVVLFEILTGMLAHDFEMGIAPTARHHFEKGTLIEIVDHKIKEETDEHVFSLSKGPNKESLDIFSRIAYRCLAETQDERPSIDVVIKELKKALNLQENHKDNLKLSLKDIKLATQNFNQDNLIGHGDFGNVYKGVAAHTLGQNNIAAKRLNRKSGQGEAEFLTELDILLEYKHENVIGLLGYCDEEDEKIIVYQYASRGSLDRNGDT
ncbi:kinase-like domain, phloem protein 2-like protein, partial [Tanacetum coccineum]